MREYTASVEKYGVLRSRRRRDEHGCSAWQLCLAAVCQCMGVSMKRMRRYRLSVSAIGYECSAEHMRSIAAANAIVQIVGVPG